MGGSFEEIIEHGIRPDKTPLYFAYHHVLSETDRNLPVGWTARDFLPTCDSIISNCRMRGIEFDCCKNVDAFVEDGGPCFDLGVDKFELTLPRPRPPNAPVSFTFDLSLDWRYILPYATSNGFTVQIDEPASSLGRPVSIPAGAHGMIDLSYPTRRVDKTGCFEGHEPDVRSIVELAGVYDSHRMFCFGKRFVEEIVRPLAGCMFPMGAYIPNDTERCTGNTVLPFKMMITYGSGDSGTESGLRNKLTDIVHSPTRCLPLCERWEYNPRASYFELQSENSTCPDGTSNAGNMTRSRVTIYIGSTYYTLISEDRFMTGYGAFLLFADVTALYLGFSVVTLAEVAFYGWAVCKVYWRTRRRRARIGSV